MQKEGVLGMKDAEWRFGVVGNIVGEHTDKDGSVYYGTKAFLPGTKVYINGKIWECEETTVAVIGRNRFGRLAFESVPINLIENIRTQRIYRPLVLEMMDRLRIMDGWAWWGRTVADRKAAESFVKEVSGTR